MKYLDARFRQPRWMMHPMQRFARESDAVYYEELHAWNVIGRDLDLEYELFYVEAERERYEAKLNAVESIRWYDLTPIDEQSFYTYVCQETRDEDIEWRRAFIALDLLVVPPIVYDDAGDFYMTIVGTGENIRQMLEELPEEIDTTVNAIGEYDRRHSTVAGDLTDRQLEAVTVAADLGFYDVPREATVADVANRLDCAPSTASNLLQKAEGSVMERVVDRHGRRA
ncbi:helix-turn-helix domain-containing protein [Halocatena marina]|uniref:Helix-turn-helix domain-containing protein n=1 Tax=Halocatena marina TaxID=2934937 RepID=A0ABD5YMQ2_9EURY|nr:helix-turn-helix domain-containing protein [Halocatena marina]